LSFFSATGLTMNCPGSAATGDDSNNAIVNSETTQAMKYHVSNLRGFIVSLLDALAASRQLIGAERQTNER
jgi:hypothetical protein